MTGSNRKSDAAARRDARAARPADAACEPVAKTKETRRWCRGKVGVEHRTECFQVLVHGTVLYYQLCCNRCGRKLDYWFPPYPGQMKAQPAWVTL